MLSYVSIIFSCITLCLMLIQLLSQNKNQHEDLATEIHRQFSEMWFVMDGIFIDCPEQHKYFYPTIEGESCMKISEKGTEEWDKAICIAEKFRDVFQYSEEISYSIDKKYRESYYEYMHKIKNTKIYKIANALNPIEYEKITPIGSLQKDKLFI